MQNQVPMMVYRQVEVIFTLSLEFGLGLCVEAGDLGPFFRIQVIIIIIIIIFFDSKYSFY